MKYLKYFEDNIFYNDEEITTFDGLDIPVHVNGCFYCHKNKLTTLEYGPKKLIFISIVPEIN